MDGGRKNEKLEIVHAAAAGNVMRLERSIKAAIRKGYFDIDAQETQLGWTAMHQAALYGFSDVMHVLLEHNPDLNITDTFGRTPLHWAAINGHSEATRVLLHAGASILVRDNKGKLAQELAKAELVHMFHFRAVDEMEGGDLDSQLALLESRISTAEPNSLLRSAFMGVSETEDSDHAATEDEGGGKGGKGGGRGGARRSEEERKRARERREAEEKSAGTTEATPTFQPYLVAHDLVTLKRGHPLVPYVLSLVNNTQGALLKPLPKYTVLRLVLFKTEKLWNVCMEGSLAPFVVALRERLFVCGRTGQLKPIGHMHQLLGGDRYVLLSEASAATAATAGEAELASASFANVMLSGRHRHRAVCMRTRELKGWAEEMREFAHATPAGSGAGSAGTPASSVAGSAGTPASSVAGSAADAAPFFGAADVPVASRLREADGISLGLLEVAQRRRLRRMQHGDGERRNSTSSGASSAAVSSAASSSTAAGKGRGKGGGDKENVDVHVEDAEDEGEDSPDRVRLHSLAPRWDAHAHCYKIHFYGRAPSSSRLNFQLATPRGDMALLFGKRNMVEFNLDIKWPLSVLEGVFVALASLRHKQKK